MENNADRIDKFVPIVQERLQRREREDQAKERRLAGFARDEHKAFFEEYLEELRLHKLDRRENRLKDFRVWLRADSSPVLEGNVRRHERNIRGRSADTCAWLLHHQNFRDWLDFDKEASNIWLRASPGVGKSVLCAYAIQELERLHPSSCCIFQYYSFDEEHPTIQVYRSFAEQLSNRIWKKVEDLPEEIHTLTRSTATSMNSNDVKEVIQMLTRRLTNVYIFVDGLDEECDDSQRCTWMLELVTFLLELVKESPHKFRLWCSSQDRTSLRPKLGQFSIVDLSHKLNSDDIQQYLVKKLQTFDNLEIDEGYRTLLSQDIRQKAGGCFLWASLMLDSISNAPTLQAIQELMETGLPQGYDTYYQRKLDDLDASQRSFVAPLLACIVHAKRPLQIEQLCEAMATFKTADGENTNKSHKIFKNQILKLCEPLVEIQETDNSSICTLSHASVRKFLIEYFKKHEESAISSGYSVIHDPMAYICLRYLSQPCYKRLLTRNGETFNDMNGDDIAEHYLLSYAAKYWDKHLDHLPYSQDLCEKVKQFLNSSHFQTCLQTQSLFVEGQFQIWYNSLCPWQGPQRRRVFPFWLSERCGPTMEKAYQLFVAEWGDVLTNSTGIHNDHPGEIDRCFWNALGPQNFLHNGQSRYKSFMFMPEISPDEQIPMRYFEGIDGTGNRVVTIALVATNDDPSTLQFWCNEWVLNGRSPKHLRSQLLDAKRSSWRLYDQPKKLPGWPVPVSLTSDLSILRIGNHIFSRSADGSFFCLEALVEEDDYFEDVISRGRYVALSSRQIPTDADLCDNQGDEIEMNKDIIFDHSEKLAQVLEESVKSASSITDSAATTSAQETTTTQTSLSSNNTSVSSLAIEDSEMIGYSGTDETLRDLDAETLEGGSSSGTGSNSAEESWSEGSTNGLSDEVDDEDQWNDWRGGDLADMEESAFGIAERDDDNVGDSEASSEVEDMEPDPSEGPYSSEDSVDIDVSLPMGYRVRKLRSSSSSSTTNSIESAYSQSLAADSDDPDADDSDLENVEGRRLADLMLGSDKARKLPRAKRAILKVYDLEDNGRNLIFHYSESSIGRLYASPPVIHPIQPLLVWPLGNSRVLFANLENNTYFIRQLCCSEPKSCHFFIKTHFSADGQHLHFAALEASDADGGDHDKTRYKQRLLHLNLQVTSHRLSNRKTARVPPSLIFRTNVPLGFRSSLSVSRPPYTLTWTPQNLYLTSNSETLAVTRIPLFRSEDGSKNSPVCYTQGKVFLPRSVESRNVYYFPPPVPHSSTPGSKVPSLDDKRQRQRRRDKATIIISSYSSEPSQRRFVPKSLMSPPIGVYLDEEKDLGGWKCKMNVEGGARGVNVDGGKLKGKFESFDLNEDCDIVPYLL